MTHKYIKRQLILNELGINMNKDIEYSYKYFLSLFNVNRYYEYRGCIYYKNSEDDDEFIYKKYNNTFSLKEDIWDKFIETKFDEFIVIDKVRIMLVFLEFYFKKETNSLHYH